MTAKRKTLTKPQLDKLRASLLLRLHRLQDEIRGQAAVGIPDDGERGGDEGDQATMSLRSDLAVDVRARETRELQSIEQALARIEDGSYGRCEDCGQPISVPRLEALPFAAFCIDCQERNEVEGSPAERREFQVLD